jgi:pyrimidine operon attenuation protein / uracil phosphoribosyltransferase
MPQTREKTQWVSAAEIEIDRGHRELPVEARYVGRVVPASARETIEVKLQEIDQVEKVVLVERLDG